MRPRPLKVNLFDAALASLCLLNRKHLTDSVVKIRADLTPLQRDQLKKAYTELSARSVNEPGLCVKYVNGVPAVVQQKSKLNAIQTNSKN